MSRSPTPRSPVPGQAAGSRLPGAPAGPGGSSLGGLFARCLPGGAAARGLRAQASLLRPPRPVPAGGRGAAVVALALGRSD